MNGTELNYNLNTNKLKTEFKLNGTKLNLKLNWTLNKTLLAQPERRIRAPRMLRTPRTGPTLRLSPIFPSPLQPKVAQTFPQRLDLIKPPLHGRILQCQNRRQCRNKPIVQSDTVRTVRISIHLKASCRELIVSHSVRRERTQVLPAPVSRDQRRVGSFCSVSVAFSFPGPHSETRRVSLQARWVWSLPLSQQSPLLCSRLSDHWFCCI